MSLAMKRGMQLEAVITRLFHTKSKVSRNDVSAARNKGGS
jgi:hypothetical protein